jgi:hypothetical protein
MTVTPIDGGSPEGEASITLTGTVDPETAQNTPRQFEGGALKVLESYFYNPEVLGGGSKWSPAGITLTETMEGLCDPCNSGPGELGGEVRG